MLRVERESQQSKVKDLMTAVPELIDEMFVNKGLNNMKLKINPGLLRDLKDFSSLVSIVISLVQLFFQVRVNHLLDT